MNASLKRMPLTGKKKEEGKEKKNRIDKTRNGNLHSNCVVIL